jgi:NAD(P)H dehydrogenase (quinone)
VLEKMGAAEASKVFAHIPEAKVEDLTRFDGFIFAFPTRFGNMAAQFKTFVDATGALWAQGALIGKPFGIITGSATQHGGQESTILTGMVPFLHHVCSLSDSQPRSQNSGSSKRSKEGRTMALAP